MGMYIQGPAKGKAEALVDLGVAEAILFGTIPKTLADLPAGKSLVCVVDNGHFDAAAYMYSEQEYKDWQRPEDKRPKRWLFVDTDYVKENAH